MGWNNEENTSRIRRDEHLIRSRLIHYEQIPLLYKKLLFFHFLSSRIRLDGQIMETQLNFHSFTASGVANDGRRQNSIDSFTGLFRSRMTWYHIHRLRDISSIDQLLSGTRLVCSARRSSSSFESAAH